MGDEKIRRRIQKALALASNNPSEEEANTALLMAQRLMLEHGYEDKDFELGEKKEIVQKEVTDYKKLFWYEKDLATIISENFRCHMWWSGYGNKNKIIFFGLKKDVEIASDVYNYAFTYMQHLCKQYVDEFVTEGKRQARNDYRLGFITGLEEKLKEQVQEYGLILVKDPEVQDKYDEKSNDMEVISSRTPSMEAVFHYLSGKQDGEQFDHERKQITKE